MALTVAALWVRALVISRLVGEWFRSLHLEVDAARISTQFFAVHTDHFACRKDCVYRKPYPVDDVTESPKLAE